MKNKGATIILEEARNGLRDDDYLVEISREGSDFVLNINRTIPSNGKPNRPSQTLHLMVKHEFISFGFK